jgi:hypothetical protein
VAAGRLVGVSRKCNSGLGFDSVLAWEKENKERSASRGSGRGDGGRRWRPGQDAAWDDGERFARTGRRGNRG